MLQLSRACCTWAANAPVVLVEVPGRAVHRSKTGARHDVAPSPFGSGLDHQRLNGKLRPDDLAAEQPDAGPRSCMRK
jgi:hypothetical protein